jgi:hypothetical protein
MAFGRRNLLSLTRLPWANPKTDREQQGNLDTLRYAAPLHIIHGSLREDTYRGAEHVTFLDEEKVHESNELKFSAPKESDKPTDS